MRNAIAILSAVTLFFVPRFAAAATYQPQIVPYVYQLQISGCRYKPSVRQQTGFRIQGQRGVVTALHGVADCETISATNDDGSELFNDLLIDRIDIAHDVVLLRSPDIKDTNGLLTSSSEKLEPQKTKLSVIGYPLGAERQRTTVELIFLGKRSLDDVIPDDFETSAFLKRTSPDIHQDVLDLQGPLLHGHSGAPIINSENEVVGIGNGGLLNGSPEISWAIPIDEIHLDPASNHKQELALLGKMDPALAFAFPEQESASSTNSSSCNFIISVEDRAEKQPIPDAEVSVGAETSGSTDSDGDFPLSLPCKEGRSDPISLVIRADGYQPNPYRKNAISLQQQQPYVVRLSPVKIESVTPTPSPIVLPTPTPTPTATSKIIIQPTPVPPTFTPRPLATNTTASRLATPIPPNASAIVLSSPSSGTNILAEQKVTLSWQAVPLPTNEFYVVMITHRGGTNWTVTRTTSYTPPEWMRNYQPGQAFTWSVALCYDATEGESGQNPCAQPFAQSETRTFFWQKAESGSSSNSGSAAPTSAPTEPPVATVGL